MKGTEREPLRTPLLIGNASGSHGDILEPPEINPLLESGMVIKKDDDDAMPADDDYHEVDANGKPIKLANNTPALTVFLLVNTMIGSGVLNQPYVFKDAGVLGAAFGFIVATYATWLSLKVITDVGIQANVLEYSGLARKAFNNRGSLINDISIVIGSFGALLGYILVIGSTMSDLLQGWGCSDETFVCGIYGTSLTFVTLFVLPLCLMRQFGHLAYVSIFSIFTIVLVLGLVTIGGPIRTRNDVHTAPVNIFNFKGTLRSVGSIIFALSCTPANFQAYVAADKPSRNLESWSRITGIAVAIGASMCAIMGIAGYSSFREDTAENILSNFTTHPFDFFKMMVVCHICAYIPVNFVIMRYSVVKLALDKKAETLSSPMHICITLFLLYFTTGFALGMIKAGLAAGEAYGLTLDITGGIGGSITGFIMPSAIYLKLMPNTGQYYAHSKFLFALGWVAMVLVLVGISFQLHDGGGASSAE
jgi:sodium-coupled neutral amino acid transporter 11